MLSSKRLVAGMGIVMVMAMVSCDSGNNQSQSSASPNAAKQANTTSPVKPDDAEPAIEKAKPASGTGNVQGKVLYDSKPVSNIEVKLCEKFSRFVGGCSGKSYTARTDKNGEYVITKVKPAVYEALLTRVFDTDSYIFAAQGIGGLKSTEYEVATDKTLFVSPTHLFKGDLKLLNPKAGAKISTQTPELKWQPYPGAAYYKFSIYPEATSVTSPYINERLDGTAFSVDKPLQKGTYRWQVDAYNSSDRKLAESSRDIKFTVN